MSASEALQILIVAMLRDSSVVGALCEDRIYDNVPKHPVWPYVSFGPSDYYPDDSECVSGRVETLQIDCWSQRHGKLIEARALADAVNAALHGQPGDLGGYALVLMRVPSVRVFRDPDGITGHGVVMVQAVIEDA